MSLIGVISDTHGLLRPQAVAVLQGVDGIIHAGDIGAQSILERLALIAPVTAVHGNNDTQAWGRALPVKATLVVEQQRILVLHDIADLDAQAAEEHTVIVTGHSHRPSIDERTGVLFVNPGSAGPRRFRLPVTLATLRIEQGRVQARLHELQIA